MTVTDRIYQLERRLVFLNKYGSQSFKKMFNVADTERNIEGQIQALKWVVEEEDKFKEAINETVQGMWKTESTEIDHRNIVVHLTQ
jgi:hypothetical protein